MIGTLLYSTLAGNGAVAALVATRIYPEVAPDEADLPLVVFTVRASEPVQGSSAALRCTVTANCYAATDAAAESVGAAVRAALEGLDGSDGAVLLRSLTLTDYTEMRDVDLAEWGRMASFSGWILR